MWKLHYTFCPGNAFKVLNSTCQKYPAISGYSVQGVIKSKVPGSLVLTKYFCTVQDLVFQIGNTLF